MVCLTVENSGKNSACQGSSNLSRISFVALNPSFSYKGRPSSLACRLTERKPCSFAQARMVSMICRAIPRFRNSGSVYTFRITARSVHGSLGFAGHGHSTTPPPPTTRPVVSSASQWWYEPSARARASHGLATSAIRSSSSTVPSPMSRNIDRR